MEYLIRFYLNRKLKLLERQREWLVSIWNLEGGREYKFWTQFVTKMFLFIDYLK